MIGVTDRQVEPDHVVLHRHPRVERRGTGVIAVMHANPRNAGALRLFDRFQRGGPHHDMAHAVVAVEERHAVALALDTYVRSQIDSARANASNVLRKSEDAVSLRAT